MHKPKVCANSVDPDQMLQNRESDQGLQRFRLNLQGFFKHCKVIKQTFFFQNIGQVKN